jgi:hypothetical protein
MKSTDFPWSNFFTITLCITGVVWAAFGFYDYFILGSKLKEDIHENPIPKKAPTADTREQISTKEVSHDFMLKNT